MDTKFLIKGCSKIGQAIGKSGREIPSLVKDHGLPAYREDLNGPWYARPDDLDIWSIVQADKHLPAKWREIRSRYQHLVSPQTAGKGGP
ncbi:MAG: hypothetical protein JEY79_01090 [Pseudodesulfovibrio sp.]|nr:hypothetical protein [Pseudodesulfovibrio sp.]